MAENTINLQPVDSTRIEAVGYDADSQTLRIRFKSNGSVYDYDDVPQDVYDALMNSASVGRYFGESIEGVYSYTRIS